MDDNRYYRPSGAAPIGGLISAVSIAGTVALLGGFLYGVVGYYNPFIYVNFIGAAFISLMAGVWLQTSNSRTLGKCCKLATLRFVRS